MTTEKQRDFFIIEIKKFLEVRSVVVFANKPVAGRKKKVEFSSPGLSPAGRFVSLLHKFHARRFPRRDSVTQIIITPSFRIVYNRIERQISARLLPLNSPQQSGF
jgi:hypothetical protein